MGFAKNASTQSLGDNPVRFRDLEVGQSYVAKDGIVITKTNNLGELLGFINAKGSDGVDYHVYLNAEVTPIRTNISGKENDQ